MPMAGSLRDEYVDVRSHEFGRVGGQRAQILLQAPKVHEQILAILEAVDLQLVDEGLVLERGTLGSAPKKPTRAIRSAGCDRATRATPPRLRAPR